MRSLIALLLALWLAPALAQVPMTGAGKGTPVAAYVGPGDVITGAYFWAGVRCYNKAYTGNVADVYSSGDATNTLITCDGNGNLVTTSPTSISSVCSGTCTVKTLYDQSGTTHCNGGASACNFVQATEANRPTYNLNCIGSLPCIKFVAASSQQLATANTLVATSAPYSGAAVFTRTGGFTSFIGMFESSFSSLRIYWANSANTGQFYFGSLQSYTISDSTLHSVQFIGGNGASDTMVVDGTTTTANAGSSSLNGVQRIGVTNGAFSTSTFTEYGVWNSGAWNATQYGDMRTNQKNYWSTP